MVYRSSISIPLFVFIFGVIAGVSVLMIAEEQWWGLSLPLLLFVFVLSFFKTYYTIRPDGRLEVRSGWFYYKDIEIRKIIRIRETNNPLSSPALSFERLEIRFGKWDTIMISPKEKEAFIDHILRINPEIKIG